MGSAAILFGPETKYEESPIWAVEQVRGLDATMHSFFENGWAVILTIFSIIVCLVLWREYEQYSSKAIAFRNYFGINPPDNGVLGWDWKDRKIMQPTINNKLIELTMQVLENCNTENSFLQGAFTENTPERVKERLIILQKIKADIQNTKDKFWEAHKIARYFKFSVLSTFAAYENLKGQQERDEVKRRQQLQSA
jgi:hypothetical protein